LDTSQKEILSEHVDDLAARVIAKAAAEAATTVPASHAYVDNFAFIVNDVRAGNVRNGSPVYAAKP
jgi:hypothetical protein